MKVLEARNKLLSFQSNLPLVPDVTLRLEEEILCKNLTDALNREEMLQKQISRVHWLKLGDSK